jgi:hypothetical protein
MSDSGVDLLAVLIGSAAFFLSTWDAGFHAVGLLLVR